jgi:ATP-dependent helicase/nuclease subunit A
VKNLGKQCGKWCDGVDKSCEKISEYYLLNSKCFLDWLGAAVVRSTGGSLIRELAGAVELADIDSEVKSHWCIKFWDKNEVSQSSGEAKEHEPFINIDLEITDAETEAEVNRRLEWEYKYPMLGKIPAKISVSELKESAEMLKSLKKPGFLEKKTQLSGAERGTIMHLVMQHLNLGRVDPEGLKSQITDMVNREFITKEEADAVSVNKIISFFNTSLGKRMISSANLKREAPFFIELSAQEVYPELNSKEYKNEKIVLQGIIDCYFEEQDGLVLLDYKTDYVEDSVEIAEKYKRQVELYADALKKLTGKIVKEKYLYLFHTNEIMKI